VDEIHQVVLSSNKSKVRSGMQVMKNKIGKKKYYQNLVEEEGDSIPECVADAAVQDEPP